MKKLLFPLILGFVTANSHADFVQGKIVQVEGHWAPSCRTLKLEYDDNGKKSYRFFRVKNVQQSDVNSIALTALMTESRVRISYTPGRTSGCGTEEMVNYITIYKD